MNRTKKEYCSKGNHPNWRAWIAKYHCNGLKPFRQEWMGDFCVFCDKKVQSIDPSGPPDRMRAARKSILNGKIPENWMRWPDVVS